MKTTTARIAFSAVLLVALLPAASAQAALSLANGVAAPASTQAGAHTNFTLSFDISGPDHIKNLVTELPAGLVGNPTSAGLCTTAQLNAGTCPANSVIGTASSNVTVSLPIPPFTVPLTATGNVFNMVPQGSDPATLGIRLVAIQSNPAINSDPVILIGHASARKSDFGLNTTILDIPQTAGLSILGMPASSSQVHIDSTALTLNSSFITNPTSCGTKTTRITATSYEGDTQTLSPTFTSTGCENEAYHPNFALTLDMSKDAAHVGHPDLTTAVTQGTGEANSKRVEAILPKTLQPNNAALINQCPLANFQAGTCPANTQVGSAVAATPLLFQALSGPVYLTRNPTAGALPQIGLDLKGPLPAQIIGNVTPTAEFRLDNVFGDVAPGLPDVPLSLFKLTFDGGTNGLITATKAVCGGGDNHFDAIFDSWGGQHLAQTGNATLKGCDFARRISKFRCKGKKLTDVGSKRANTIRGTRKRDVINGLGGNDKIIGLKGNDLLCGGGGKDKISGGPGKDKLFGGAGKDTLVGGGGKDKLAGGAGKDLQKQ
jgi:RTX calcium-binding nonapeptide repeat (4 copies)